MTRFIQCLLFPSPGGAESRQAELGASERRAPRLDHRGGH